MKSILAFLVCLIPICADSQIITSTYIQKTFHDGKKKAEESAIKYGIIAENHPDYDLKEQSRVVIRILDLNKGIYRITNIKNFRNGVVQTDTDQPFSDVGANMSRLERDLKVVNQSFSREEGLLLPKFQETSNLFMAAIPLLNKMPELSGVRFDYDTTRVAWVDTIVQKEYVYYMNYQKLPSDQDTMNIKYWGIAYPIEPEKINSETGNLKGISF
ncbi:MAG: hypothetical protein ACRCVT_16390, partial [Leadbetterella sp.]